jgi:23S rRNA (uracil747-C5)-methyltransferase
MSVTGTSATPSFGIVRSDLSSADLRDCNLSPEPVRQLVSFLTGIVTERDLIPYDIRNRTGELKHVIVMATQDLSQGIVRFVLRSTEAVSRIRKSIDLIQQNHPWVRVISCNIQPVPAAILEGTEEIVLTEERTIVERYGDTLLYFSPQSFMQVTPEIATKLYSHAQLFASQLKPQSVLDLYCGVGGFSLHVAPQTQSIIGVEISQSAISNALQSASELGFSHARFYASDVVTFLHEQPDLRPDLIITNPPRRGLEEAVISHIIRMKPAAILYSSCNPETFARDAQLLSPCYALTTITPFDMFPMTHHWEVLGTFALRS